MRLSGRSALRTRQESRRLGGFGKKWQSGKTLTVLYPIFWENGVPNILVAAEWGHSVDPKAVSLKRIFVPTNSEIVDGKPTTKDTLFQFSRLAPLFLKGEYELKREAIRKKAGKLAESVIRQQEAELDKEYEVEDGVIKKNAAVGRLRYVISTEVIAIPHKDDGSPDIKEAGIVTQDLSDEKLRKLNQVMDQAKFGLTEEDKFLEVTYTFGTTGDRKKDGRVDPVGVTPDYRISARYPSEWEALASFVQMLPEDSGVIMKRNSNYAREDERKILQAIQTYSVMNSELLDALTEDTDIDNLKSNAELLRDLQIPIENQDVQQAIVELNEIPQVKVIDAGAGSSDTEEAPSITSLLTEQELEEARQAGNESADAGTDSMVSEDLI